MTNDQLVTALIDGYAHVAVIRDRDLMTPRQRTITPDDCLVLTCVSRARHPTLGSVEVLIPVPTVLYDDPDYTGDGLREEADAAVACTIASPPVG